MYKNNTPKLYNIGLSYKKADVKTRAKFSLSKENQLALLQESKEKGVEGIFVLSTCNRTEITGYTNNPFKLISLLCKYTKGTLKEFAKVSYINKEQAAINHLFRIATGLDSQILGDYEIVGQLKQAFKQAKKNQTTNAYLERLFNSVMQASKQVKNETKLSSGTTSVSYAAVQYLINKLPNYNLKKILILGLGKIGKHTCKNISQYTQNRTLCLINRTHQKTEEFAKTHPFVRQAKYKNLKQEIALADVLIVSTGADEPIITKDCILPDKKLLILDLSMPANVAENTAELKKVDVVNIDQLSKITHKTLAIRQREIPLAEVIIDIHKADFNQWLNHRKFTPAINALKQSLLSMQKDEIAFYRKKTDDFNQEQAEALTSRFIQKITTQFAKHLKNEKTSINQSIEVMLKVFANDLESVNAKDY
ncbi:MAG: glutamyl-tRNA reductase [Tenacibaculum sp.]